MQPDDAEIKIKERFDNLCQIFPEKISSDDPRVKTITDFFGDVKGKKILDAGCGKGRFSKVLCEKGAFVTCLDFSEKLLNLARKNLSGSQFVQGTVTALPFLDNSFDFVFSVEVIEHVPNYQKAIGEMVRVLKKGGKIVVIDKNNLSCHRKFFVPNILIKKYMEASNKWFYPRNFQFSEKWFFLRDVDEILKGLCKESKADYIKDNERIIFSLLSFLNLFIVWKGVK